VLRLHNRCKNQFIIQLALHGKGIMKYIVMLVLNKPFMRVNAGSQVENNSKLMKSWQLSEDGADKTVAVKPNGYYRCV